MGIYEEVDMEVVVVPCVGDAAYARRQMQTLSVEIGASPEDIPTVLEASPRTESFEGSPNTDAHSNQYFVFGEPHQEILSTFQKLRDENDLVIDLIYGAPSWTIMLRHWNTPEAPFETVFDPYKPLAGREIMYVHSGGLEGINSQLLRYKYKELLSIDEIQLPGKSKR